MVFAMVFADFWASEVFFLRIQQKTFFFFLNISFFKNLVLHFLFVFWIFIVFYRVFVGFWLLFWCFWSNLRPYYLALFFCIFSRVLFGKSKFLNWWERQRGENWAEHRAACLGRAKKAEKGGKPQGPRCY